jgi:hypothetical protein
LVLGFDQVCNLDLPNVWPTHVEFATDVTEWLDDACSVELRILRLVFKFWGSICLYQEVFVS